MNKRKSIVISLAVCAVWLAVWQTAHLLVYARMGSSLLLPSPLETLQRLGQLLGEPDFYSIVGHTVLRIFSGFLLGTAVGCLLGGLTAFSPLLHRFFALPMNAIKSTPVASFVILALVWIKGENLSTFIALLMVLPVIWQGVHTGLQSADPDLLEMAQVYRFSRGKKLRYLYLPAALPHLRHAGGTGFQLEVGHRWRSDRYSLPGHRHPALPCQDLPGYARAVCLDHCDHTALGGNRAHCASAAARPERR